MTLPASEKAESGRQRQSRRRSCTSVTSQQGAFADTGVEYHLIEHDATVVCVSAEDAADVVVVDIVPTWYAS